MHWFIQLVVGVTALFAGGVLLPRSRHPLSFLGYILMIVIGFAAIFFSGMKAANSAEVPPVARVTDLVGKLSRGERDKLSARIQMIEKLPGSPQVAILIQNVIDTTVTDHAQHVFTTWKLGSRDRDNGVLILIAPAQRQLRIHTGYGVEPVLPDVKTAYISSTILIPNIVKNRYYDALDGTLNVIASSLAAESVLPMRADMGGVFLVMIMVLGVPLLILWSVRRRAKKENPVSNSRDATGNSEQYRDRARTYATTAAGGMAGAAAAASATRRRRREEDTRRDSGVSDALLGAAAGYVIGSALSGGSRSEPSEPSFSGGGGDSGGGGSSSSWSDSSSSSSSDSGSSGGGDSGGGGGGGE